MSSDSRMKTYFHVDIDAFFAAVELIDDPSLAGKPLIVGALPGHRGVVSTCSYEARKFGVRSAMPISEAARRCPSAVFLPVRMERYAGFSTIVMSLLGDFTPDLIRVSIDEASMDMSGTERIWGPAAEAAMKLKNRVRSETGLSVSVGVAANRYIAKLAAGYRKPDGLVIVPGNGEADFMAGLELKDIWGAGAKTRERFDELGIRSIQDLRSLSDRMLSSLFGKAGGDFLYKVCRGIDPGIYAQEPKSRSMSTETTFDRDVSDMETLECVLLGMSMELSSRMYEAGQSSRCVALKLRYDDFETLGARQTMSGPFLNADGIYAAARLLLGKKWNGRPIRLIGIGLCSLEDGQGRQTLLFEPEDARVSKVEQAAFDAGRKGLGKITRASLLPKPRPGAVDD
jgi:DNA polymerase IV